MSREKVYNVGLVGTGYMAQKHVEILAAHPRIRCSSLNHTPRAGARAAEWRERYGFTSTTDDFEQFLSVPDLDLVWICSPNDQHFTQTERALRVSKHVFCEKPLALSSNQAAYLNRLAQSTGQTLAVGMNCRFRSQYVAAKRVVESELLGRLFLIRGTYLYNSTQAIRERQKRWWLEEANQPLLLTSGLIHTLDLMIWLAGDVRGVMAFGESVLDRAIGDDTLVISLRFNKGIIGELVASMAAVRTNDLALEVYGERGSVIGNTLIVRDEGQFRESCLETSQPTLDLELQLENILAALDGRDLLMNDSERAARNLRVCEGIEKALAGGRTIEINYDDL